MSGSAIVLRSPLRLIGRMASRRSGLIQGDVPEQVVAPALGGAMEAQAQREVGEGLGAAGSAEQPEAGLVGSEVALPAGAGDATGDDGVPPLGAPPPDRDHVVEGELPGRKAVAAILDAVVGPGVNSCP